MNLALARTSNMKSWAREGLNLYPLSGQAPKACASASSATRPHLGRVCQIRPRFRQAKSRATRGIPPSAQASTPCANCGTRLPPASLWPEPGRAVPPLAQKVRGPRRDRTFIYSLRGCSFAIKLAAQNRFRRNPQSSHEWCARDPDCISGIEQISLNHFIIKRISRGSEFEIPTWCVLLPSAQ